jgi:putative holliday junction resolvase
MNKKSRILALDVGKKRIGVAISDELKLFASPMQTIPMGSQKAAAINEILRICKEYTVSDVIVGNPVSMSGEKTDQGLFTEKFVKALTSKMQADSSENSEIRIRFLDERLTSVQAEQYLAHSGKKNIERRKAKDQISASILLETYLLTLPKKG